MPLLPIDIPALLLATGYLGLFCMVFAESGLFFGFFLPGDSLLFTAGLLAANGTFNIAALLIVLPIAAMLGDSVGYWFGSWVGPHIFIKDNSLFFDRRHALRAKEFYEKYGPRAIILARFVPMVRTFVPIVAGVGSMKYATFVTYNVIGGLLWGTLLPSLGYFLGRAFPSTQHYLTLIIALIIVISFLPIAREWWLQRKK
ncbi:MAG TPA: VTT domain-containing protein [Candidatus Paceibacterota bacterium]